MSAKAIATENMTIEVVLPVKGDVEVISKPSKSIKANSDAVYCGPLKFKVTNIKHATVCGDATAGELSEGVIKPTANFSKADGKFVIREGDKIEGLTIDNAKQNVGGVTTGCTITFTVKITDAGQSDVKGS